MITLWSGSYQRYWPLATGDTVEIVKYIKEYSANYVLDEHGVRAERYLHLQFRSDLQDSTRDRANTLDVASLLCPEAGRLGFIVS